MCSLLQTEDFQSYMFVYHVIFRVGVLLHSSDSDQQDDHLKDCRISCIALPIYGCFQK